MTGEQAPSTTGEPAPSRPRTRPRSIVAGLGLIALWWSGSIGMVVGSQFVGTPDLDWTGTIVYALWTLVVAAMLRATWRGGPISWWFLSRLSTGFGVIIMVGGVLLGPLVLLDGEMSVPVVVLLLVAPFAVGGVLYAAGHLLRREDAQRWCNAVPGDTTPRT